MSSLFGCLFFLLFAGLMFLLMPFVQLTNFLFGGSRKPADTKRRTESHGSSEEQVRHSSGEGKIFKPGEGEYVDFEEVSEE